MIKSITARQIFKTKPQVRMQLWGGEFWSDGYFASTVGKHGNEHMLAKYVQSQENEYQQLHSNHQLALFGYPVRLRRGSSFYYSALHSRIIARVGCVTRAYACDPGVHEMTHEMSIGEGPEPGQVAPVSFVKSVRAYKAA